MLRDNQNRNYGWDVELVCGQCGTAGLPRYEGWSPSLQTNAARNVQVYAKVACAKCGKRLTDEAGRKIIDLFSAMEVPARNKKLIAQFITRLFLVPAGLAFVLFFGMQMDWWSWGLGTVWILTASAVAIPLIVVRRNRQLARLPGECECGKPHNIFMGSLDDASCYRCYSCGRMMKVRE